MSNDLICDNTMCFLSLGYDMYCDRYNRLRCDTIHFDRVSDKKIPCVIFLLEEKYLDSIHVL